MAGSAGAVTLIVMLGVAANGFAQPAGQPPSPFEAGRAALAAHDPTTAVRHFSEVDTREGQEWLAVALMMESRSPSDHYVERAFEAAQRSRLTAPGPTTSRAAIAASLRPGDMVITFLIGAEHAYAWAFDRDAFVGYPLPDPPEIATAVERAAAYLERKDRDGLKRITDDLLPALLGPATERLSTLTRLILVTDGPLRRLPFAALNIGGVDTIETADYGSVSEAVARAPAPGARQPLLPMAAIAVVLAVVVIAGAIAIKRR